LFEYVFVNKKIPFRRFVPIKTTKRGGDLNDLFLLFLARARVLVHNLYKYIRLRLSLSLSLSLSNKNLELTNANALINTKQSEYFLSL
jgi:hypothetical protein